MGYTAAEESSQGNYKERWRFDDHLASIHQMNKIAGDIISCKEPNHNGPINSVRKFKLNLTEGPIRYFRPAVIVQSCGGHTNR